MPSGCLQFLFYLDYQDLYDLLNTYEYKPITESTYQISTNEDWETFKRKFYRVTRTNDNVKAIVLYNGAMDVRTIR